VKTGLSNIKTIYGDLNRDGIWLRLINGQEPFSWSSVFEGGCIHLILNLTGQGIIIGDKVRMSLTHSMLGLFHRSKGDKVQGSRLGSGHECVVLSVSRQWVDRSFGSRSSALHPELRKLLSNEKVSYSVQIGKVRAMSLAEKEITNQLLAPPVHKSACVFWYSAKVLELLSTYLFVPASEGLCSERKRLITRRLEKVILWLKEHLDEPLDLSSMAKSIGCAPHYLSRQFSAEVGMTISQKLRQLRVDKAAEFLRAGDYNVTEAAVEVGYNSLSHFTKVFILEMGMKPSEYLDIKNVT